MLSDTRLYMQLECWPGPLQDAATEEKRLTAVLIFVSVLLIWGNRAQAAQPAYTLEARLHEGYRPQISVRVNGAGPFWCRFGGIDGHTVDSRSEANLAGLQFQGHA